MDAAVAFDEIIKGLSLGHDMAEAMLAHVHVLNALEGAQVVVFPDAQGTWTMAWLGVWDMEQADLLLECWRHWLDHQCEWGYQGLVAMLMDQMHMMALASHQHHESKPKDQ